VDVYADNYDPSPSKGVRLHDATARDDQQPLAVMSPEDRAASRRRRRAGLPRRAKATGADPRPRSGRGAQCDPARHARTPAERKHHH
jgi:hypothetical protein